MSNLVSNSLINFNTTSQVSYLINSFFNYQREINITNTYQLQNIQVLEKLKDTVKEKEFLEKKKELIIKDSEQKLTLMKEQLSLEEEIFNQLNIKIDEKMKSIESLRVISNKDYLQKVKYIKALANIINSDFI